MWSRRKKADPRLDTELRYHFDRLVRDFIAAGVPPAEARRRAQLEFGGIEQLKEECLDVRDGSDELVMSECVSGTHYALLGVEPAAGRLLEPADDVPTPAAPAAVISYRYWRRRFGLSPEAIGKTFAVRDTVFTIVGVTPR